MIELRLFVCQLSLAFFFAPVDEKQSSFEAVETIATHPRQAFVRPVFWESEEAKACPPTFPPAEALQSKRLSLS